MKTESIVKILQIVLEDVTEGKFIITPVAPSEVEKDVAPVKDVEEVPVVEEPEEKEVEEETPVEEEVVEEPVKKEVESVPEDEEEDLYAKKADELKDKTVAELRTIAREMGLPIRGSKSVILGRIVEALLEQEEAEVENVEVGEPVEEEPEVADEVVEETEEVEDDEVDEVEEEDEEPADENEELQAKLEQLDVEDLADLCNELEIPAKGKKQGLIARLMKAHMDGDIDLSDLEFEEAEEEEDIDEDEGIDVKEILGEQPLKVLKAIAKECGVKVALKDKKDVVIEKLMGADEDALANALVEAGIIELDDDEPEPVEDEVEETEELEGTAFEGSEERQEKCIEIFNETAEAIENGDIEESDIREFFEDRFKGNKSELKKIENTDFVYLANMYCCIVANLVDDDGVEVELEEPYMVGDTPYCCGVPMKKLDETTYLCEIDGEEVELED